MTILNTIYFNKSQFSSLSLYRFFLKFVVRHVSFFWFRHQKKKKRTEIEKTGTTLRVPTKTLPRRQKVHLGKFQYKRTLQTTCSSTSSCKPKEKEQAKKKHAPNTSIQARGKLSVWARLQQQTNERKKMVSKKDVSNNVRYFRQSERATRKRSQQASERRCHDHHDNADERRTMGESVGSGRGCFLNALHRTTRSRHRFEIGGVGSIKHKIWSILPALNQMHTRACTDTLLRVSKYNSQGK